MSEKCFRFAMKCNFIKWLLVFIWGDIKGANETFSQKSSVYTSKFMKPFLLGTLPFPRKNTKHFQNFFIIIVVGKFDVSFFVMRMCKMQRFSFTYHKCYFKEHNLLITSIFTVSDPAHFYLQSNAVGWTNECLQSILSSTQKFSEVGSLKTI